MSLTKRIDDNKWQGSSWVICCVCDKEFLVADACAVGHPDDPPWFLCQRCSTEHSQAEMEENMRYAYYCARIAEV